MSLFPAGRLRLFDTSTLHPTGHFPSYCQRCASIRTSRALYCSTTPVIPNLRNVAKVNTTPRRSWRALFPLTFRHPHLASPQSLQITLSDASTVTRGSNGHRQSSWLSSGGAVHEGNTRDTPMRLLQDINTDFGHARRRPKQVHCFQRIGGQRPQVW